jgi:hypothetical protein
MGTIPNGLEAQLTDVVGNRTVTVKAETTIDGVLYSRTTDVTFGNGPMSVFTTALVIPNVMWATRGGNAYTAGSYGGDFTLLDGSSSVDFPVAVGVCGGSVNVGAITTNSAWPYNAIFDTSPGSGWRQESDGSYYSTTSKLPTAEQLLAISNYSSAFNASFPRRGAFYAANIGPYALASGLLYFTTSGEFSSIYPLPSGVSYVYAHVNASPSNLGVFCVNP